MIKVFYDLETTGVNPKKHSVHQIAGLVEIDGEIVEEFNIFTRPHPKAIIEPEALAVGDITEEQILAYPPMEAQHKALLKMLSKYIDRYNKKDKAWLVGYNNRSFDDVFLRAWFKQCKDIFFGSWFWSDSIDVLCLSSQYLLSRRAGMDNFQLGTVAKELGIFVDSDNLHDGLYDVKLTRQIYKIVTGEQEEDLF